MLHVLNRTVLIFLVLIMPGILYADENAWTTNGPYGGSVLTIAIHPFDNQIIYIGTVQNGIYKTTDGGESWNHLGNGHQFSCMRDISIHPFGPDTIFAATTDGIFKSTNGGDDWAFIYTPEYPQNEIISILIHPEQPELIFAGGPVNEWKSIDGGSTWERLPVPRNTGIEDISIDPGNPDILYFVSNSMASGNGIWKSEDRGQTLFSIQNNIDSSGYGKDIEVDYENGNILYLAVSSVFDTLGACLYKSENGGDSWFDISPDELTLPYIFKVVIYPSEQNTVFLCTSDDGVFRSHDGGDTWQSVNSGLNIWQIPTMEIDLDNYIIYLGTFYDGIYKSITNGENWQKISSNISSSPCKNIDACSINPGKAYVTMNSGLFRTSDLGESWERVEVGIHPFNAPTAIFIDKLDPYNLFMTSGPQTLFPINAAGFHRSEDDGASWTFFNDGLPEYNFYVDINIAYQNQEARKIFLASRQGVYYSEDNGESWLLCNNGLPQNRYYRVIDICPSSQNVIASGNNENEVFLSIDCGVSWVQLADLPYQPYSRIMDIEFNPNNPNEIYVSSYKNGIYKTDDGGFTWENINANLPVGSGYILISSILINRYNTNNIFVGLNGFGIFQTFNGGISWESLNAGLDTTCRVDMLKFAHDDTTELFLSTLDRSVWTITRTQTGIADKGDILPSETSLSNYPNPFNASTNIKFSLPNSADVKIDIYDILGRRVSTIVNEHLFAGYHSVIWNPVDLSSGAYFYKIEAGEYEISKKMILLR